MGVGTRGISVTGLGATTPLGGDVATTWAALLAGRSGVRRLTGDWTAGAPVAIGAPIVVEPEVTAPKFRLRRMDRSQQLAFVAAHEAWRDAGFAFADQPGYQVDHERLSVSVASSVGGILTVLNGIDAYPETGWKKASPYSIPKLMPNGAAGLLSVEFKARAGAHAPTSACASSAEAIGLGIDIIRSGRADIVITGGTDAALHEYNLSLFDAMGALSNRNDEPEHASRPFDKGRDGFVLGEGAGIVILESEEHARARGARVYAIMGGVGYSSDAYNIARPEPGGTSAAKGIGRALRDAGLEATDIAHINAHGSATTEATSPRRPRSGPRSAGTPTRWR